MKSKFLAFLLSGLAATLAPAQNPHVHSTYFALTNVTVVETDLIHAKDSPAQFVQVFLRGSRKGQKSAKSSWKIVFTLLSTSDDAMFEFDGFRNLRAIGDGQKMDLGEMSRVFMRGQTVNGKEVFTSDGAFVANPIPAPPAEGSGVDVSSKGLSIPLPQTAQVRKGKTANKLITEYMQKTLTIDQLAKLAGSRYLEVRVGNTSIQFSDEQQTTIRDFANLLNR